MQKTKKNVIIFAATLGIFYELKSIIDMRQALSVEPFSIDTSQYLIANAPKNLACNFITIRCDQVSYERDSLPYMVIDAEIENCADSSIMLYRYPYVGKNGNGMATFLVNITDKSGNLIEELDSDLDFFNIDRMIALKPRNKYSYQLYPFGYLYSIPPKGEYKVQVYFYNQKSNLRRISNKIAFKVI